MVKLGKKDNSVLTLEMNTFIMETFEEHFIDLSTLAVKHCT